MSKKSRQGVTTRERSPEPSKSSGLLSVLVTILFAALAVGYVFLSGEEPPSEPSSATSTSEQFGPLSPLCAIVNIPGKAFGIRAVNDIPEGTRILQEHPLITLPAHIPPSDVAKHLTTLVDALPRFAQTVFYSLANTTELKLGPSPSRTNIVHNIYHTNAILASDYEGRPSSAIFPTTARINHSCRPNAVYFFREDLGAAVVHTLRDIRADEEILISYLDASGRTATERQEYLDAAYGFKCNCDVCSLQGDALVESDSRRSQVAAHTKHIEAWINGEPEPEDADDDDEPVSTQSALSALHKTLRLLEEEEYTFGYVGSYSLL